MFEYQCCGKKWKSKDNISQCLKCKKYLRKKVLYSFKCCGKSWKSRGILCYCYYCNKKVDRLSSVRYICKCGHRWSRLTVEFDKDICRKCKKLNSYQRKFPYKTIITKI